MAEQRFSKKRSPVSGHRLAVWATHCLKRSWDGPGTPPAFAAVTGGDAGLPSLRAEKGSRSLLLSLGLPGCCSSAPGGNALLLPAPPRALLRQGPSSPEDCLQKQLSLGCVCRGDLSPPPLQQSLGAQRSCRVGQRDTGYVQALHSAL